MVTATHAKMRHAAGEVGPNALLVVDEPPSLVRHDVITLQDLAVTENELRYFGRRYADALAPLLGLVTEWMRARSVGDSVRSILDLAEVEGRLVHAGKLRMAIAATQVDEINDPGIDALACARAALEEGRDSPTIEHTRVMIAKRNARSAELLGTAARTLAVLHNCAVAALAESYPPMLRVEETPRGDRVLRVVGPNLEYREVLETQGRVVLLDATDELRVPEIRAVTGREPAVHRYEVSDGAPVERAILPYATATISQWIPNRVPKWDLILPALTKAIAWARESADCTDLCLISFRPIVTAIQAALQPEQSAQWGAVWSRELELPENALREATEALASVLAGWQGSMVTAYYWGLRGMNTAQHVQALITLGDPRSNIDAVEVEAAYVGLPADNWVERRARAELEQAHGRLRAPQRKTPARALHVGSLVPYGYGWDQAKMLPLRGAVVAVPRGEITGAQLREIRQSLGMSQAQMAAAMEVGRTSLARFEQCNRLTLTAQDALKKYLESLGKGEEV